MALGNSWTNIASGSFTFNGATLTYYIDAKLDSQSIANNTSTISTRARTALSGYSMTSYNVHMSCTGCTPYDGNNSTLYTFSTKTVLSGSTTVSHSADGTKTFSMSGACTGNLGMNISISGSIALPTIPRASSATFSPSEIVLNGSNSITVSISRASSSFAHTLKFSKGTVSTTVSDIGTSYTWTPTVSKWMPVCSAKNNTVTVTLTTYNGSTQIGSAVSYTVTLKVDQNAYKPTISSVTLSDTNATTAALETSGSYIKGKSNLKAVVAFGVSNSTYVSLVGATITCGSDTRSISLSGTSSTQTVTFNSVSSNNFSVTVVDNRGVTATSTQTLTIIPYNNINIQSASYTRVNENEEATEVGDYIKLKVVTSGFVGTFGQSNNVQTLSYRYKLHSASSYGSWANIDTYSSSSTGSISTHTFNVKPSQSFSFSNQYDVQVRVTDQFSNATMSLVVHQGIPVYAWGQNHFDIYGSLHIHDRTDPTQYTEVGAVGYMPPLVALTDCDDATDYGVRYRATTSTANTPLSGYFQIYVFPYGTTYRTQIAFLTNTQSGRVWVRSNNDGGWGAWRELYTTYNSGVETVNVSFSGAVGGTVPWTVFKFGSLRLAVCKWRSASNATINSGWNGLYTSTSMSTPDYPLTFSTTLYTRVDYVAADANATYSADCWTSIQTNVGETAGISGTNAGTVFLVRPDSGVTIGHPVFTQIVIGTV